jgi:hypothetical protein
MVTRCVSTVLQLCRMLVDSPGIVLVFIWCLMFFLLRGLGGGQ